MSSASFFTELGGVLAIMSPLGLIVWNLARKFHTLERDFEQQIIAVDRRLDEIDYQQQLKNQAFDHLDDKVALAVNGLKETATHVRERTHIDAQRLSGRIADLEGFLAKTTSYEPRRESRN